MKGDFLNMKKNKMMRLASGLLVAVLLTTCVISGTFAKYVTSAEGTDTARVAKWGVAVTANGETFKTEYAKDDTSFSIAANTVVSTDKVVAPGTKGTMASMTLSGTPEVAARVSYEGHFDVSDNWTVDGAFYCPLVIKVGETAIYGSACTSAAEFENAVNAAINGTSKDYAAGTDLSADTIKGDSLEVSWEWPFTTGDENDQKDTALGNQAVVNNAATVTLDVKTTVTQID